MADKKVLLREDIWVEAAGLAFQVELSRMGLLGKGELVEGYNEEHVERMLADIKHVLGQSLGCRRCRALEVTKDGRRLFWAATGLLGRDLVGPVCGECFRELTDTYAPKGIFGGAYAARIE